MAKRGIALPASLTPQLATLVSRAPSGENWAYEIKFDGYRMLARVQDGSVRLLTRNNNDWTDKLLPVANGIGAINLPDGWYDGEIVVLDNTGIPNFNLLQNALKPRKASNIVYYLFDAPFCAGRDLRDQPLSVRREELAQALGEGSESVRLSQTLPGSPRDLLHSACAMGLEGIIGKRCDAPYVSRRSDSWVKLKCHQRQEFVVGGFTEAQGVRSSIGSLLLGLYDEQGHLQYAGSVGTGWGDKTAKAIRASLNKLLIDKSPYSKASSIRKKDVIWVAPTLVVEVEFAELTPNNHVRHASFKGMRLDKPAKAVTAEAFS